MTVKFQYSTSGTCSRLIEIEVEDGLIKDVSFIGGCHGNLQGIGTLVKGMRPEDVIARLENIKCGDKLTSCPDQLSKALRQVIAMQ